MPQRAFDLVNEKGAELKVRKWKTSRNAPFLQHPEEDIDPPYTFLHLSRSWHMLEISTSWLQKLLVDTLRDLLEIQKELKSITITMRYETEIL